MQFESSVISYGNQTFAYVYSKAFKFESSVISYGNQTTITTSLSRKWFESSVISYGNQTAKEISHREFRLRVV